MIAESLDCEVSCNVSFRDVVTLVRPKEWTKNTLVFAALIFARQLFEPALAIRAALAFVALCAVSSGVYAANDAIDADRDARHPVKRNRPVAAGRVSRGTAFALAIALVSAGLALSAFLDVVLLVTVALYLLLQVAYSAYLKHVLIVDMLAIAAGFVLRAIAGAVVIYVAASPWLVLCTGLLALFLAAAKRRHELVLLEGSSAEHRPVLEEYSPEMLDGFMTTLAATTITSYALYGFFASITPYYMMMSTVPFVVYGVLRYQYLVLRRQLGGRPAEVLLGDKPMLIAIALWLSTVVLILYVLRPALT